MSLKRKQEQDRKCPTVSYSFNRYQYTSWWSIVPDIKNVILFLWLHRTLKSRRKLILSLCLFIARLVHISHLPRLQELYTCQLFVLVSTVQFVMTESVFVFIHLSMKPVCLLKVCDCGVWGSGHPAERPEDPWDVPECHEEVQSGFTEG